MRLGFRSGFRSAFRLGIMSVLGFVLGHSMSIQQIFGCFSTDPLGLF